MSALGLVHTEVREAVAPETTAGKLQLFMDDAFASSQRLWFRGRLQSVVLPSTQAGKVWWHPWRRSPEAAPPPQIHLHTRIGGLTLEAGAALSPEGRFEVLFPAGLPAARRGWRVARHQVSFQGQTAEACNVVLAPPETATAVVAVILPIELTLPPGALRGIPEAKEAARLTRLLQDLERETPGQTFCFLAAVPSTGDHHQAELALATTALGWPAGSTLLVRIGTPEEARPAFVTALDRLRWLFAGSLDLRVLNLEPSLEAALAAAARPETDRADVRELIQTEGSPVHLYGTAAKHLRGHAPRRPTRAGMLPRHPIVFCHGMLALSLLKMQLPEDRNCFSPLRAFLEGRGVRALFPQVSPTSGVAERAAELRDQIRRWTDEPVNLVAHSMGGLDARHMITHLGMAGHVRSLTTVSTPHRGTFLADWFVANFRNRVPLLLSLQALGVNVDGFRDCCLAACREFNARTPDAPEVHYFSYGGSVSQAHLSPALRRAWNLLLPVEGPNDGMVSVASARWGTFLGTLHADHYAQTPDATFVRPGENFDTLGFYSRLVEHLARRGF